MSHAKRYSETKNKIKHNLKGLLLYFLPFPLFINTMIELIKGDVIATLISGLLFSGFIISAMIGRHGFKLEFEYQRKKVTKASTIPFKTISALLLSITTALTAWLAVEYPFFASLSFGFATFLGFYLYYGLDPRKDKTGNLLGVSADELIEALEAANIRIDAIETAGKKIKDFEFAQRLKQVVNKARKILETIEEDPKDLQRSRKFLKVYLRGTQKIAEGYAETDRKKGTNEILNTDFRRVLDSIDQTFDEQQLKLMENDQFDLDVQIKVLETQLKHEGIS